MHDGELEVCHDNPLIAIIFKKWYTLFNLRIYVCVCGCIYII